MEKKQEDAPDTLPRVSLWYIARTFLGIGLASFSMAALGEAKNWMTKKRRWFSDEEYLQGLGLAQLMPGAPTVNLSAYLGFRLRGLPGAFQAHPVPVGRKPRPDGDPAGGELRSGAHLGRRSRHGDLQFRLPAFPVPL